MAAIKKVDLRNKDYKLCPCCDLIQHVYQFNLIKGTQDRDLSKCLACKRELCTKTKCKLGTTHDR